MPGKMRLSHVIYTVRDMLPQYAANMAKQFIQ